MMAVQEYKSLFSQQELITAREKQKYEEFAQETEEERLARKAREQGQQGGGRTGLMFGGNEQGVL